LLQLTADDSEIHLNASTPAEFDNWMWVSYWYPLAEVVAFKRDVYRKALLELVDKLPI
jgi:putative (di)nucleoside polyphosphate hydrolase